MSLSTSSAAPLSIESAEIHRGTVAVQLATARVERTGPGAVAVRRGNVVERLQTSTSDVEQSWSFERVPEGRGPLTVHVRVQGLEMAEANAAGLHFRDAATGRGFVYGHATWVDAKDERTPVPARWLRARTTRAPASADRASEIELAVPEAVLARSAFPATLDPLISPEFALGHPGIAPTEGDDDRASVAFDGANYFVVWDDGPAGGSQVKGTRVTTTGDVLDPGGITVGGKNSDAIDAQIAFDGANYLVVWQQSLSQRPDGTYPTRVHGMRLGPDGRLLDAPEIEISSEEYAVSPKVAFCGTNYFVVWGGAAGPVGAHIGKDGALLDTPPIVLPRPPGSYGSWGNVARAPSGCLVTWYDGVEIKAARVGNTGPLLDAGGITISKKGHFSSPAFDGTNNLVAWMEPGGALPDLPTLNAVRVNAAGSILDSPPISVTTAVDSNNQTGLSTAWDGANFVLAWSVSGSTPNSDVWSARLTSAGTRVEPANLPIATEPFYESRIALAAGPTGLFAVWQAKAFAHFDGGQLDIIGARVQDGVVLDTPPIVVSTGPSSMDGVAVASDGTNYLVGWRDNRDGTLKTDGVRLSASGAPLATTDTVISSAGMRPVIASSGAGYVVSWLGGARRVGFDGALTDTADIPLTPTITRTTSPTLACGDSNCLAAWSVGVATGFDDADIEGAIVLPDGTAKDTFGISTSRKPQVEPAVASDGANFVVVWADCRDDPSTTNALCLSSIYAARVSKDGELLDGDASALQITTPDASGARMGDHAPAIAYDGAASNYIVAWAHGTSEADILGVRLRAEPSLRVLDDEPIVIANAAGEQAMPRVSYAGDGYHNLVVWEERAGASWDIYGNWVTSTGTVADTFGFPIGTGGLDETFPVVAANGKGNVLVAYGMAERPAGGAGAARLTISVAGRLVSTLSADGMQCANGADCASSFCRDGVCCNSDCNESCRTCGGAASPGVCSPVTSADDDTCTGSTTCDSNGVCLTKTGASCAAASDCATRFCSDGFCCDAECGGACDTCAATPGTCTLLPKGTAAACTTGNLCDGVVPACPTSCGGDADCAPGYSCSLGTCAAPCAKDGDCPTGALCNTTTGKCESGGTCQDDHTVLKANGTTTDCGRYACAGGVCKAKCTTTADCARGNQCDERGACSTPQATVSDHSSSDGCAVSTGSRSSSPWALGLAMLAGASFARRRRWVALAAALFGCSPSRWMEREAPPASSPPATPETHVAGPVPPKTAFDLAPVRSRTHFAYRPDADGSFSGGHSTYSARVARRGALTVAPAAPAGKAPKVELETVSIRRGSRTIGGRAKPAERREDGSVVVRRGSILETMQNGPVGVEQSFSFSGPPPGTGDLTIRVRVSGLPLARDKHDDLLFADPATGLGVRYGHAVWVDARGERSDVRTQWTTGRARGASTDGAGQIVLTVPSAVLARSRYPAVLDPTISPELPLSSPEMGSVGNARAPAVATDRTDGANYLTVFQSYDPNGSPGRAILVDKFGVAADAHGVPLPGGVNPAVASGAGEYLVVWEELGDIRGARVSRSGQIVDTAGIPIAGTTALDEFPSVAWCGTNYFVAWTTRAGVFGVHVDSTGAVLDATPLKFTIGHPDGGTPPPPALGAVVAGNGSECLVVWLQDGVVAASRVGSQGVLDDPGFRLPGSIALYVTTSPSVASNGSDFFIVYDGSQGGNGLFGARVNANGVVLDRPPFLVSNPGPSQVVDENDPTVAWDEGGQNYFVVWRQILSGTNTSELHGIHVTPAGTPVEVAAAPLPESTGVRSEPTIAPGSNGTFLVWSERTNIFGSRLNSNAAFLPPTILLSGSDAFQEAVDLASDGKGYFAVWHDTRAGQDSIFGTRLDANGQALDPTGIPISKMPSLENSPVVAYDGTEYLVAWMEVIDTSPGGTAVRGARVGVDGKSGAPFAIDTTKSVDKTGGLSVDCLSEVTESTCLVGWTQTTTVGERNIAGAIVAVDNGNDKITGLPISNAILDQLDPAITSDGTNFFVVWTQIDDDRRNIWGGRIRFDGAPLDGKGVALSTSDSGERDASATYDSSAKQYLVVWERIGDVRGTRVVVDNDVLKILDPTPGLAIAGTDGRQTLPRVVYTRDGHNTFVAWQNMAIGATSTDVFGTWVNSSGNAFGAGAIAGSTANEKRPAVAAGEGGKMLVAYELKEAVAIDPPSGILGSRTVSPDALDGTVCKADGECASRKCRDGFCCQRECDTSCETCGDPGSPGVCTCTGTSPCTTSGTVCAKKTGAPCTSKSECATDFCADGFCCDSACSDGCATCAATPGTCTTLPKGSLGRTTSGADAGAACSPGYLCDGVQSSCPTSCNTDEDCGGAAPGYHCAQGECVAYCVTDEDCPRPNSCDTDKGTCYAGAKCEKDPESGRYRLSERGAGASNERKYTNCDPYICTTKDQACLVRCTTSADCSSGNQCDEQGACSLPLEAGATTTGCGCRVTTRGHEAPFDFRWVGGAGVFLLAAARRRRYALATGLGLGAWGVTGLPGCASRSNDATPLALGSGGATAPTPDAGAGRESGASASNGLGAPCARDEECAAHECVRGRCTQSCAAPADCPPGPEWSCAFAPGHGPICACSSAGPEVCDGRDNDCNAAVDDGAPCPGSLVCQEGACACPTANQCAGACVDTAVDVANCGGCGIACSLGSACTAGKCACPAGKTVCNGACFDLSTTTEHCGSCTTECSAVETCNAGRCVCANTLCGGTCISLSHDAKNCGRCGRSCRGGDCVDGECTPIPVVLDDAVRTLAVDGASLYWVSATDREVRKSNLDGTNVVKVADIVLGMPGDMSMGVRGANVYWGNEYGIMKAPSDGSAPPVMIVSDGLERMAFDATHIYWTNGGVHRADLDGRNAIELGAGRQFGMDLAVSGNTVFWAEYASGSTAEILSVGVDGGAPRTLATSAKVSGNDYVAGTIAVDETRLYWSGYYAGATQFSGIFTADKDGRNRKLLAKGSPTHLFVDERSIYWTTSYDGIYKAPLDGGEARLLAAIPLEARSCCYFRYLVQDSDFVYYCMDANFGGIWKVAK